MDRAFDARELRRELRKRGIRTSIPERKRRGKRRLRGPRPKQYPVSKERYKVERVNAWMDTYRALVVRYERTAAHYLGYCILAYSCASRAFVRLVWCHHDWLVASGSRLRRIKSCSVSSRVKSMNVSFRDVVPSDATLLAHILVTSNSLAFRGVVPDRVLEFTETESATNWRRTLLEGLPA